MINDGDIWPKKVYSSLRHQAEKMLMQEVFSALALALLIGLGYLSNFLTYHINVQVLSEEHEVS